MNALLDQSRIDEMRAHVMSDVDDDVQRRGRRTRRIGVGLAAFSTVAVLAVAAPTVLPLTGTERADELATSDSKTVDEGAAPSLPEGTLVAPDDQSAHTAGGADTYATDGDLTSDPNALSEDSDKDREVITFGDVATTVDKPHTVAQQFATWVEAHGGRVDARSESAGEDFATASLTVRVPSVTDAIAQLKTFGKVTDVNLTNDDVTAQGKDLDARIKALKISIDRLEGILEDANTSEEIIAAEGALSQRQEQLESYESQRRSLSDQVALSTINVQFNGEDQAEKPDPEGFWGGLVDGWNALVRTLDALVTALGAAIPWLGVGLVLAGGWFGVRKLRNR